ncbi:MAG: 50S ribosomal protein L18 [Bdellovibrionaceae bacterium]|nr:50S ribosomal protein L18 [Pseudobdellovibrionaceae bacterium]
MKLKFGKHTSSKQVARLTKKIRIRKKVNGTDVRPRLCVFRSGKHMYAQIIDDVKGHTVLSASSLVIESDKSGKDLAFLVGQEVAKMAIAKNIKSVVFDRNGFIYHGRVKALADGAREAGLSF